MSIGASQAFEQQYQSVDKLVLEVQEGSQIAFKKLYDEHLQRVYTLCLRLLADRQHAEDATQEVFIQLWHKIRQFNGRSLFSTWLHSMATNIALSYLRKHKNWLQKIVSIDNCAIDEQLDLSCDGLNDLDKLIIRLPERARLVFVLHAIEGYRHQEISVILSMAEGTSKSQYFRAKRLLKEWYENDKT